MPPFPKWIKSVSPDDQVADVAVRSLKSRFAALQFYLPLAAKEADKDTEYVHQLRVWTRRATAAIKLYRDLLPSRRTARVKKHLKCIRRAANSARDYDVLIPRLAAEATRPGVQEALEKARERRADAQQQIVSAFEKLTRDDRFARRVSALLRRLKQRAKKSGGKTPRFRPWAVERLQPVVERFFKAGEADLTDISALHEFRISGKELRYTMELLSGAFAPPFRRRIYPVVQTLQDTLGEINDHATALACFRSWIEETADPEKAEPLRALVSAELLRLEEGRRDFFAWWSFERSRHLREQFRTIVSVQSKE